MSPDVAAFLLDLVNRQQVAAGAPDFASVAGLIVRAQSELVAVLEGAQAAYAVEELNVATEPEPAEA
jgi:hypothetical protein